MNIIGGSEANNSKLITNIGFYPNIEQLHKAENYVKEHNQNSDKMVKRYCEIINEKSNEINQLKEIINELQKELELKIEIVKEEQLTSIFLLTF